jgi:hypothetical protein
MASINLIRKKTPNNARAASRKGEICGLGNKTFFIGGNFKHRVTTIKTEGKFKRDRKIAADFWSEADSLVKMTRIRK